MLKQLKWSAVLTSAAYIAAGVLMFIFPDASADAVSIAAGTGLALYGLISLAAYFIMDVRKTLYRNEFVKGITAILIGLLLYVRKDILMSIIPMALGFAIVWSGFLKLQKGIVSARIGGQQFGLYTILSLISIAAGCVIMFYMTGKTAQELLFKVIGGSLAYSGLSDLFATVWLAGKFDRFITAFENEMKKKEPAVQEPEVPEETPEQEEEIPFVPVEAVTEEPAAAEEEKED